MTSFSQLLNSFFHRADLRRAEALRCRAHTAMTQQPANLKILRAERAERAGVRKYLTINPFRRAE